MRDYWTSKVPLKDAKGQVNAILGVSLDKAQAIMSLDYLFAD